MRPRDATTEAKQLKLRCDNKDLANGWILLNGDGTVILSNQKSGEDRTGKVVFTLREFNALVDWYNRDQKPKSKRRL